MRPKRILLLAAGAALLGSLVPAQESKPFLTPAEVLKMMGESKTEYVVNSLEKLKPEETKDLAGLFFAQRCPDIENPRLVSEKGKPAVKGTRSKRKRSSYSSKLRPSLKKRITTERARSMSRRFERIPRSTSLSATSGIPTCTPEESKRPSPRTTRRSR